MSIKLGMISLGCAKNLVDGEHMLAQLADAGVTIVDDVAEADVARCQHLRLYRVRQAGGHQHDFGDGAAQSRPVRSKHSS